MLVHDAEELHESHRERVTNPRTGGLAHVSLCRALASSPEVLSGSNVRLHCEDRDRAQH
jgi:hypothetical protein